MTRCHLLGKVCALQEDTGIAGPCMKLRPHLVSRPPLARHVCPVERLLAFFDALLAGATLSTDLDDPVRVYRQIGHDKADAREQPAGMSCDPRDHPTGFVP